MKEAAKMLLELVIVSICTACVLVITMVTCLIRKYLTKPQLQFDNNETDCTTGQKHADNNIIQRDTGQLEIPFRKEYFI